VMPLDTLKRTAWFASLSQMCVGAGQPTSESARYAVP
jgi:hypothetical protein